MKFRYKKIASDVDPAGYTLHPLVQVSLRYKNRGVDLRALIDSGAADSMFHRSIGNALGIDIKLYMNDSEADSKSTHVLVTGCEANGMKVVINDGTLKRTAFSNPFALASSRASTASRPLPTMVSVPPDSTIATQRSSYSLIASTKTISCSSVCVTIALLPKAIVPFSRQSKQASLQRPHSTN